ncbi:MAG TPA: adenosylmethionine--8-amino-7-oxononanoate transaminase [Verrucomicrobiales bacterium]|nr:adenosylmethionine--8-amino-7-oxononanoate transaminase [Verrucomicrobiales bacterium]
MHPVATLDHRYVWHPFTQMRDWLRREPILLAEGRGAVLRDIRGREYLDANSSIWTQLHGHGHPAINRALARQMGKLSHCSALGFANEPAARLAAGLVQAASAEAPARGRGGARLAKVFFSDNGSTAMEVGLKLAYEYARRVKRIARPRFLSLQGAYHGDTVGAVSLGHIDLFHKAYGGLLFKSDRVMAPYCYRCPFNRARPERADAREYRVCGWECVSAVEGKLSRARKLGRPYAGFVVEPLMQGAAGMIPQPEGWLRKVAGAARQAGALILADEVMTGFGRTGIPSPSRGAGLFACHREGVVPDFLALAKGLTGGYLPMAATLTTEPVFEAFLGEYSEFKTFFHGHSFTGNPLGAAASLASLDLLLTPGSVRARARLERWMRADLATLWDLPQVGDVRQVGLVAGVELVRDWRRRTPFDLAERRGIRVCERMASRGVLTRPIGNVIVLMPPYCTTRAQLRRMVEALRESIAEG